jgi:hypothetical protein
MKLICSLCHCECDGHTAHKLSQGRLTADWLAPRESDCSQMHSKVSSDWLPSYIKATRPVLDIFKMDEYFPDSPRIRGVLRPADWPIFFLHLDENWTGIYIAHYPECFYVTPNPTPPEIQHENSATKQQSRSHPIIYTGYGIALEVRSREVNKGTRFDPREFCVGSVVGKADRLQISFQAFHVSPVSTIYLPSTP